MESRSAAYLTLAAAVCVVTRTANAQGSLFTGRVVADSVLTPLAGAGISLPALGRTQRADQRGEFRFTAVPAGEHVVMVRVPGYAPRIDTIIIADAGEVRREFRLAPIQATLPEVPVTATLLDRRLYEFHERRRFGIGRFLDSAEFAKAHGTRTSDKLARLPGLIILRGRFSDAYAANNRQRTSRGGLCRSAIWLDGINLGIDYNVNLLHPNEIAAIEWYAGQASIPAQFNTPPRPGQSYCGVLVIWTR